MIGGVAAIAAGIYGMRAMRVGDESAAVSTGLITARS